ncbi:MAG: nucleotide sugar dehydrogenase [Thermoplasmata archaeon]|nr:nucleotide sugar dehydrogenase [Thermoplasmata archaeon]
MREKAAVIGMGYVGIPLACLLAKSGVKVTGIDIDRKRVELINKGEYPLKGDEPNLPEMLNEVVNTGLLRASTDFECCEDAQAIFICVDTPIDDKKKPIMNRLISAVDKVGSNLCKDSLIVVESTVAPGTMRNKVLPLLEKNSGMKAGKEFYLAHCPERVMSGKLIFNLVNLDRVLGGLDEKSTDIAKKWYEPIMKGNIHTTDMTTAEVVKTSENTYRDVQIAFANEVALICEKLGIDAFEVRKLVNTSPFRDMHLPGAGVGGHCLPKDPWLLVHGGKDADPQLIPTARKVNDRMPEHVAELVLKAMEEAKLDKRKDITIAILGYSFLENSGDSRNSPAKIVIDRLHKKYNIAVHDPFAEEDGKVEIVRNLDKVLRNADCAVFLTRHKEYLNLKLEDIAKSMKNKIIIDGRNIFDKKKAERLGFIYKGIGKG